MNEYLLIFYDLCYLQGREVTQLVEAPRHKTGGLGFDFRQDLWKFSCDPVRLSAFSSIGIHSASNRNEYQ